MKWTEQTFWILTLELLHRHIAPLHLKTETLAETALHASWFWATSARFPGTSGIFYSPENSKLTADGLGFQWNGHSKTFWTLAFELLGQNIAPLHLKTKRVAETVFRASLFWATFAQYPGTWGIFSTTGASKLTPDGLGLEWNWHSKTLWTLTFKLLGRNIGQLYLKTHRVGETVVRASWFWQTSARFPGIWGIFSSRGHSKLTPDGLGLEWNWHSKTFWMLAFKLLGRNIAPLHFKTQSSGDHLARIVLLTNFGSLSRNLGDIFQSRGL